MKNKQPLRIQNAECNYNGFQDAQKGFDLLRDCVKCILDKKRLNRQKENEQ